MMGSKDVRRSRFNEVCAKICASEVVVITQTRVYGLRRILRRSRFTTPLTCDCLPLCAPFTSSLLPPSSLFLLVFVLYCLFAMLPNRNLRIHNAHTLGPPPPTLPCSYCPRHFHSKTGRTRHMQAMHADALHADRLGPQVENPSPPLSPNPSLLERSSSNESQHSNEPFNDELSLVPSNLAPSSSPSHGDMDIDAPNIDWDYTPPGSDTDIEPELYRYSSPGDNARGQHVPEPPRVTRSYHHKMNGESNPSSN
jgi:hypothetical protein